MLAIDIGNTFTRMALFRGDDIVERRSFHTGDLRLDELLSVLSILAPHAASGSAWIASVAPGANAVVDSAAERAGLARRFIRPGVDPIMPHGLKTPLTTGVDRLLASMAAGALFFPEAAGGGYVTVQCGSAVTVDFVDGGGVFRGGYILPGPAMWLASLATAAQLPDLSVELVDWDDIAIGDNTRDAILHGMAAALPLAVVSAAMTADMVPGKAPNAFDRAGPPAAVTGGWGEAVARHLPARFRYDRDLVLRGIRLFAEREGGR